MFSKSAWSLTHFYWLSLCTQITIHFLDKVVYLLYMTYDSNLLFQVLLLAPTCHMHMSLVVLLTCAQMFCFRLDEPDEFPEAPRCIYPNLLPRSRLAISPLKLQCVSLCCLCVVCLCFIAVFPPHHFGALLETKGQFLRIV